MSLSMNFLTVLVAFLNPPPSSVRTHPPIHPTVLFLFHLDPYYGAASHCKSKETLRLGCYGNMETVQGFEGSDLLNQFRGDEMGTVERGDDETGMSRNLDMFKDKFVILQFLGFYSNKGLKV